MNKMNKMMLNDVDKKLVYLFSRARKQFHGDHITSFTTTF